MAERENVTWETCSLRKWLNKNFYNGAFNSSEQAAIRETSVVNNDNPEYGTAGGNDTMDYIYILSLDEVGNADYGFVSDLNTDTETRQSNTTDYAKYNYSSASEEGKGAWWLRSPGDGSYVFSVTGNGNVRWNGVDVHSYGVAVRPALHLNLSSSSWSKSGQISSGGIEAPVPSESPSAGESPRPSVTPDEIETTPPLPSDLPQTTKAPQKTNIPVATDTPASSNPSESPAINGTPKPGGNPDQTATTSPQTTKAPTVTASPVSTSSSASPNQTVTTQPQAINAPSVTAAPVPACNAADTGKLGKVSIKSAKNSKKSAAVVTWKKVNGASGYQIQYALDQKFAKGTKTKTTAGTSYTLKKLKKKKTYYVRVRALKKAGSKNVYEAWSKVKKVKIKK